MSALVLPSPEIWHRDEFSLLCNWRTLYTAVEVGVDKGEFSIQFMEKWCGRLYLGVDDWQPRSPTWWDRSGDFQSACIRYERWARMAALVKLSSTLAAEKLSHTVKELTGEPGFGFVYLDGSHHYQDVCEDLVSWWPLVLTNGILAGHDFDSTHPGVVTAVTQFAERVNLTVYLTRDKPLLSWYLYKSSIPGPDWRRVK